jgi:hypothetical protein
MGANGAMHYAVHKQEDAAMKLKMAIDMTRQRKKAQVTLVERLRLAFSTLRF